MTDATRSPADRQPDAAVFDAVLFDMDGTLVDSTRAVEIAWDRFLREEGLDPDLPKSHGVPSHAQVEEVLPPERWAEAKARYDAIELETTEGVVAFPGIADLLAGLGSRWTIVTSCSRALALVRLAAAGLSAPDRMVTVDDVTHGKPDPEPFARGAAVMGTTPRRCLAVEDAPAGLASARSAGCTTLGVASTHPLAALDADTTVAALTDVGLAAEPAGVRLTRTA
ncbi:sugar-phosphatase [Flavimobilis soli]|uniref:Sugar-phosphatase n=1 Tax=Flavimobilis soli TaxID=442709 RepID=A0A2A9EGA5_9MICO|nr:HAD-IA family hydrolase [Flavimobilis soli]PFG37282.1 sugar-phosphatase [Flavimobilis soli]